MPCCAVQLLKRIRLPRIVNTRLQDCQSQITPLLAQAMTAEMATLRRDIANVHDALKHVLAAGGDCATQLGGPEPLDRGVLQYCDPIRRWVTERVQETCRMPAAHFSSTSDPRMI